MEECDVMGRVCFYNAMKKFAKSSQEECQHCKKDCDFVQFKLKLKKRQVISHGTYFNIHGTGSQAFVEFLKDENRTFIDNGLRNAYNSFINKHSSLNFGNIYPEKKNEQLIVVRLRFKQPEINIISTKYTFLPGTLEKVSFFGTP